MPPSPRDSSDRSPAPPPFPRPSAPSSIGCINASSTTSINSFTPWASRSPHDSRPEHRTSQREQNPRYRPHNGLIRNTLREDSGTLPSRAGRVTEPKGAKRALSDLQQSVVGPLLAS